MFQRPKYIWDMPELNQSTHLLQILPINCSPQICVCRMQNTPIVIRQPQNYSTDSSSQNSVVWHLLDKSLGTSPIEGCVFKEQLTLETRGETGGDIPKSNSQDMFQQLDLTTGANYNQYLIMFNCGNSDRDVALYHEFCPGVSAQEYHWASVLF